MAERKGGDHIEGKRQAVKFDAGLHAELKEYADGKGVTMGEVVEDALAKVIKFDMFGETWDDIEIDPLARGVLLKYSQTHGNIPRSVILSEWIMELANFDIRESDWREKRAKAREGEMGSADQVACEGRAEGKNKDGEELYSCVWYQKGRPPQIRILGVGTLQKDRCAACGRTEEIARGFEERDTRIVELETELGSRSTARLKVPKCNRGAVLNHDKEDQLIMTNCFRHRGEPVSVDKFCRVQARGLPCMFFAFLVVGVEGAK